MRRILPIFDFTPLMQNLVILNQGFMTLQTKYIFHKSGFIVFGAEVLTPNTQWNKGIEYLWLVEVTSEMYVYLWLYRQLVPSVLFLGYLWEWYLYYLYPFETLLFVSLSNALSGKDYFWCQEPKSQCDREPRRDCSTSCCQGWIHGMCHILTWCRSRCQC